MLRQISAIWKKKLPHTSRMTSFVEAWTRSERWKRTASGLKIRTAYTSDDAAWLCGREKWKNLRCIGAIRKEVEADGKRTEEWHYYISSRRLSAEELLHHARMEWAVESMHWLLDVHYGEDYCRIASKAAQQNLRRHRTTRRRVGRCLFRHLRHANSSIYLQ